MHIKISHAFIKTFRICSDGIDLNWAHVPLIFQFFLILDSHEREDMVQWEQRKVKDSEYCLFIMGEMKLYHFRRQVDMICEIRFFYE